MLNKIFYSINLNQLFILLFLLINVGLYYEKYLSILPFSYVILFLGVFLQFNKTKTIKYTGFIIYSLLFLFISFLSISWSFDSFETTESVTLLSKSILISIFFIQLIRTKKDLEIAFFGLGISSLIFVILYLSIVDVSSLEGSRITDVVDELSTLPNINLVGIFGSFAFAYFLFQYFLSRKKIYIVFFIISFLSVVLLGSRKSLIAMLLAVILLFPSLKSKHKVYLIFFIFLMIAILVNVIPTEYLDFILLRFDSFLTNQTRDDSDNERIRLLSNSFQYIELNPFFGSGYYNYASLNFHFNGQKVYSHNNLIETIVGVGLFGFLLYYYIYCKIIFKLYQNKSILSRYYLIIFFVVFINHFFIVLTNEKFIWILLASFYALINFKFKHDNEKKI